MFKSKRKRNRKKTHSPTPNASGKTPTFIGPGVVIEGTLQSQAPLRIDGRVQGNIDAKEEVTIGESGIVEGPIKASRVVIAGEVLGDVTVAEFLHVLPSGRLKGSTHTPRLIVEEGALFKGQSEMAGPEKEANPSGTAPLSSGRKLSANRDGDLVTDHDTPGLKRHVPS